MFKKRLMPLLFLFTLFSGTSHAEGWYYAKVVFAGKEARGTFMRLEHWANGGETAFPSTLFKVDETLANEILAIGMAALASNKLLVINTDLSVIGSGTEAPIKAAYLTNKSTTE